MIGTERPTWRKRRHCPHSDLEPIYGDEINRLGGYRLICRDCGRLIDGPPTLAASRKDEPTWKHR